MDATLIEACEDTSRWQNSGENFAPAIIEAVSEGPEQGQQCVRLKWDPANEAEANVRFSPEIDFSGHRGISFWLRVEGENKDGWKIKLRSIAEDNSFAIVKDISLDFDGWVHVRLLKRYFMHYKIQLDAKRVDWSQFKVFEFTLGSGKNKPEIYISDIQYIPPPPEENRIPEKPYDHEMFWWWRGPIDRFAAMHLRHATWPRATGQGEREIVSFSEFLLAPGMPYTVHLRNDNGFSRFVIKISDYDGETVDTIDIPIREEDDQTFRQKLDIFPNPPRHVALCAPQKCGTYVFDVDCYDKEGNVAETYQTGVFVMAKILDEPSGYWGLQANLGTKASSSTHHSWMLDTLNAFGVKMIREQVAFPTAGVDGDVYTHKVRQVCELAKERNIRVDVLLRADNDKAFDFSAQPKLICKPGLVIDEELLEKDCRELAASFKGLVDIWDCYGEVNRYILENYVDILRPTYRGLKQGDPETIVSMGNMDVYERWPTKLIDIEKETGEPLSDVIGTHYYPDQATIGNNMVELYPPDSEMEDQLRMLMLYPKKHLPEKGLLMDEGGLMEMDYRDQSLIRERMFEADYSAEAFCQYWYARYAPMLLAGTMRLGGKLHGCCFFRCVSSMGRHYEWPIDVRIDPTSFFSNQWGNRDITLAKAKAYTLNTIARLMTYEVELAEVAVTCDKSKGRVENNAFKRPGETIAILWIGAHIGMRAEELDIKVTLPEDTGLVLVADQSGNETVAPHSPGGLSLKLTFENVSHVRMLEGKNDDGVFMQHIDRIPEIGFQIVSDYRPTVERKAQYEKLAVPVETFPGRDCVNIYIGTPADNPRLLKGIAGDRDLPVVSENVPLPGQPLALYSSTQRVLYIVGQSNTDLDKAVEKCTAFIKT